MYVFVLCTCNKLASIVYYMLQLVLGKPNESYDSRCEFALFSSRRSVMSQDRTWSFGWFNNQSVDFWAERLEFWHDDMLSFCNVQIVYTTEMYFIHASYINFELENLYDETWIYERKYFIFCCHLCNMRSCEFSCLLHIIIMRNGCG